MQANKIILVHNHPSGNAQPSKKDIDFTQYMHKTSALVGIDLMDHLVIGDKTYTSIYSQQKTKIEEK